MVMRRVVVLRAALDPMRRAKDRRSQHQDRGCDHEYAEHGPLGIVVAVGTVSLLR